jgi:outer membrane lipoprotein SlyB
MNVKAISGAALIAVTLAGCATNEQIAQQQQAQQLAREGRCMSFG